MKSITTLLLALALAFCCGPAQAAADTTAPWQRQIQNRLARIDQAEKRGGIDPTTAASLKQDLQSIQAKYQASARFLSRDQRRQFNEDLKAENLKVRAAFKADANFRKQNRKAERAKLQARSNP